MSDRTGDDRRDEERQPIELKVEYKRLNAFFADYTRNISKGGTFIATNKPLPIGTEFLFRLFVPKLEQAIEIKGRVKWIVQEGAENERSSSPGMGIRFVYADDSERKLVEEMVEKLMTDSLGKLLYAKLMERSAQEESPNEDE